MEYIFIGFILWFTAGIQTDDVPKQDIKQVKNIEKPKSKAIEVPYK